jgi:hypothetical protein
MPEEKAEKIEYEKRWCKYELTEEELKDAANILALKTQEMETKRLMTSEKSALN